MDLSNLTATNQRMDDKFITLPSDAQVETVMLKYVQQESVSLYEAVDPEGEIVALLIAEAVDEPERFEQRSEAEQSAMQVLALDEYYKGLDGEGTIIKE